MNIRTVGKPEIYQAHFGGPRDQANLAMAADDINGHEYVGRLGLKFQYSDDRSSIRCWSTGFGMDDQTLKNSSRNVRMHALERVFYSQCAAAMLTTGSTDERCIEQ